MIKTAYICDRCGNEIKPFCFFKNYPKFETITITSEKTGTYNLPEEINIDMSLKDIIDQYTSDEITIGLIHLKHTKQYDLCGKCKKAVMDFIEKGV